MGFFRFWCCCCIETTAFLVPFSCWVFSEYIMDKWINVFIQASSRRQEERWQTWTKLTTYESFFHHSILWTFSFDAPKRHSFRCLCNRNIFFWSALATSSSIWGWTSRQAELKWIVCTWWLMGTKQDDLQTMLKFPLRLQFLNFCLSLKSGEIWKW